MIRLLIATRQAMLCCPAADAERRDAHAADERYAAFSRRDDAACQ